MDYSYDALRMFAEVAEQKSFSRAAEKLFRSQSAISLQIAKLEGVMGRRLLERSTKKVSLTDAGQILLKYVHQTEALLEQAKQELLDLDRLEHGRLVICTSDTTGCYRLPAILQRFRGLYPGIDIVVQNATSPRTIESVLQDDVDLGIATLANLKPGLESIRLLQRKDVLICHPQHRLAGRKRVFLKDLENYPFILLDRHCTSRLILDECCAQAQVILPIHMELSSIEVIKRLVRIDVGISVVPEIAIQDEVKAKTLLKVDITDLERAPGHYMGIIYKRGRYQSLAAKRFIQELKGYFASRCRA